MRAVGFLGRKKTANSRTRTKTCTECNAVMTERRATIESPYRYTLSGLSDVYLTGILVRQCPVCKLESPTIPRQEELLEVIREGLVQQPNLLTGEEIRFLRKNAGYSIADFAALLDMRREHLSRVENGKTPHLGPQADKLTRLIVTAVKDMGAVAELLLRCDDPETRPRLKGPGLSFKLEKDRWLKAA